MVKIRSITISFRSDIFTCTIHVTVTTFIFKTRKLLDFIRMNLTEDFLPLLLYCMMVWYFRLFHRLNLTLYI